MVTPKRRTKAFKKTSKLHSKSKTPLWKGPEVDGITQSLLSRWLYCRERFRLRVVEGLAAVKRFNVRLEYGNLWHACEEALAQGLDWRDVLGKEAQQLGDEYRESRQEIEKWWNICATQFPIYVDYWAQHEDVKNRESVYAEEAFAIPY